MASDQKRLYDLEYLRIFASELQNVPAWQDLAESARQIYGSEVDDRRRKLEKIRDSVKYRPGDTLVNVEYEPEDGKPMVDAITGEAFTPSEDNVQFRTAIVKNVIQNFRFRGMADTTHDYLDLAVTYSDPTTHVSRDYRWLMPFTATQERDILLRNAYNLGFNFFNAKLSDQDLQRVVEGIQMYWNEAGADDLFVKFIGFIKNIDFSLVPLWTEGPANPTDTPGDPLLFRYPYLKPWDETMRSMTEGGFNWLTSHVILEYNLAQFTKFYTINLDDIEQLFYYFAPIIVVMDRIIGRLNVDVPLYTCVAAHTTVFEYAKIGLEDAILNVSVLTASQATFYVGGFLTVDVPLKTIFDTTSRQTNWNLFNTTAIAIGA